MNTVAEMKESEVLTCFRFMIFKESPEHPYHIQSFEPMETHAERARMLTCLNSHEAMLDMTAGRLQGLSTQSPNID